MAAQTELHLQASFSRNDLTGLEPEWWALWERTPARTPFQSPAWIMSWLTFFSKPSAFWFVTLSEADRLRSILTLLNDETAATARLPGQALSDYQGMCYDPECPEAPSETLSFAMAQLPQHWSLDLEALPEASPLLQSQPPAGSHSEVTRQDVCPVLALPTSSQDLERVLAPKFYTRLAYARRRLEREFEVSVHRMAGVELDAGLDVLFELHSRRWEKASGTDGVLAKPKIQAFHRQAAAGLDRAGALRLYVLELDGEPASVFYGFRCGPTTFFYLSGLNPIFEKFSVGSLVIEHAIRRAVEEQCSRFDFLRGSEVYKYQWGARDETTFRRVIRV